MGVLSGLKPEKVFYYFEEICKIPHGSGNVDQISDYLADFSIVLFLLFHYLLIYLPLRYRYYQYLNNHLYTS